MKKLKWLLLLLVACCCIGCGKGDEAAKTGNDMVEESGEDTSKDDEKDVDEKDDDEEGGKDDNKDDETDKDDKEDKEDPKPTDKPAEKQPAPYSVTQNNKFEIDGTWYDETGTWELIFDVSAGTAFPSIAEGVLTNGNVNATVFLDESNRESDSVVYPCYFDGTQMGAKLTFTEDGILLENHELLDKKVLFTRPEGYVAGPQVDGYPVTQGNLADIMGYWHTEDYSWELEMLPYTEDNYPNIVRAVLTNGSKEVVLCLDESGRVNEYTIQAGKENYTMYDAMVLFTEDGVLVQSIPEIGFEENIFVRADMYSGEPIGAMGSYSLSDVTYQIVAQIIGNGNTYYIMEDMNDGSRVVSYENRENFYFTSEYFVAKVANYFYDIKLLGYPVVLLTDYEAFTEMEYEEYCSKVQFVDKTNECYFPGYFDAAYYCADQDMWLLQAKESGTPFEVAGADVLSVENDVLQFVGRIRNTGSRKNVLMGAVTLYDKYGDEIETYAALAAVLADDYYIDMDNGGRIRGIESMGIGAGEEAQLILVDEGDEYLTGAINLSSFSDEVKYIQVTMLQWNEWTVGMDSLLNQIDN